MRENERWAALFHNFNVLLFHLLTIRNDMGDFLKEVKKTLRQGWAKLAAWDGLHEISSTTA